MPHGDAGFLFQLGNGGEENGLVGGGGGYDDDDDDRIRTWRGDVCGYG